jgi:hypothetical protein
MGCAFILILEKADGVKIMDDAAEWYHLYVKLEHGKAARIPLSN